MVDCIFYFLHTTRPFATIISGYNELKEILFVTRVLKFQVYMDVVKSQ